MIEIFDKSVSKNDMCFLVHEKHDFLIALIKKKI
jgi:hypothetical protein